MTNYEKLKPQDFINMQDGVIKFNQLMGNAIGDKSLIPTYNALSIEEANGDGELLDSVLEDDMEGVCDGLIDLVFTNFYYALLKGVDLRNEMSYLDRLCTVGVVVKHSLYEYACLILSELKQGNARSSQRWLLVAMVEHQDKFDFIGAFKDVEASNLSKFVKQGEVNVSEEVNKIESAGRYGGVFVEEIGTEEGIYLAFRAMEDKANNVTFSGKGKMIKVEGLYTEPSLAQFIRK